MKKNITQFICIILCISTTVSSVLSDDTQLKYQKEDKLSPASRFQSFLEAQEGYEMPFQDMFGAGLLLAKTLKDLKVLSQSNMHVESTIADMNKVLEKIDCKILDTKFVVQEIDNFTFKILRIRFKGVLRNVIFCERDIRTLPQRALDILGIKENDIEMLSSSDVLLEGVWILGKKQWGFLHSRERGMIPLAITRRFDDKQAKDLEKNKMRLRTNSRLNMIEDGDFRNQILSMLNLDVFRVFGAIANSEDEYLLAFWRENVAGGSKEIALSGDLFENPELSNYLDIAVFHECCEAAGKDHDSTEILEEQIFGEERKARFDAALLFHIKLKLCLKALRDASLLSNPEIERIEKNIYFYMSSRKKELYTVRGVHETNELIAAYSAERDSLFANFISLLEFYLSHGTLENQNKIFRETAKFYITANTPLRWGKVLGSSMYNSLVETLTKYHVNDKLFLNADDLKHEVRSLLGDAGIRAVLFLLGYSDIPMGDMVVLRSLGYTDEDVKITEDDYRVQYALDKIISIVFPKGHVISQFGIPIADDFYGQTFVIDELLMHNTRLEGVNTSAIIRATGFLVRSNVISSDGNIAIDALGRFIELQTKNYENRGFGNNIILGQWIDLLNGRGENFSQLIEFAKNVFMIRPDMPNYIMLKILRGGYYGLYQLIEDRLKGVSVSPSIDLVGVANFIYKLQRERKYKGHIFNFHDIKEAGLFLKVIKWILQGKLLYRESDGKFFEIIRYDSELKITQVRGLDGRQIPLDFNRGRFVFAQRGLIYWIETVNGIEQRFIVDDIHEGFIDVRPDIIEVIDTDEKGEGYIKIGNGAEGVYQEDILDIRLILNFHMLPDKMHEFTKKEIDELSHFLNIIIDLAHRMAVERDGRAIKDVLREIIKRRNILDKVLDKSIMDCVESLNRAERPQLSQAGNLLERVLIGINQTIVIHERLYELIDNFDKFIFPSEQTRNMWMDYLQFPEEDVSVVDNESWHELYAQEVPQDQVEAWREGIGIEDPGNKKILCYTGRLGAMKGYEIVREFILNKLPEHKDWILVVATSGQGGSGKDFANLLMGKDARGQDLPEEQRLKIRELIKRSQIKLVVDLSKYIFVIDNLIQDEGQKREAVGILKDLYKERMNNSFGELPIEVFDPERSLLEFPLQKISDVFIFPTFAEAASLSIYEADEAGCKVVTSQLGGNLVSIDKRYDRLIHRFMFNAEENICLEQWQENYGSWIERFTDRTLEINGESINISGGASNIMARLKKYIGHTIEMDGVVYILRSNYIDCKKIRVDIATEKEAVIRETDEYYQAIIAMLNERPKRERGKNYRLYRLPAKIIELFGMSFSKDKKMTASSEERVEDMDILRVTLEEADVNTRKAQAEFRDIFRTVKVEFWSDGLLDVLGMRDIDEFGRTFLKKYSNNPLFRSNIYTIKSLIPNMESYLNDVLDYFGIDARNGVETLNIPDQIPAIILDKLAWIRDCLQSNMNFELLFLLADISIQDLFKHLRNDVLARREQTIFETRNIIRNNISRAALLTIKGFSNGRKSRAEYIGRGQAKEESSAIKLNLLNEEQQRELSKAIEDIEYKIKQARQNGKIKGHEALRADKILTVLKSDISIGVFDSVVVDRGCNGFLIEFAEVNENDYNDGRIGLCSSFFIEDILKNNFPEALFHAIYDGLYHDHYKARCVQRLVFGEEDTLEKALSEFIDKKIKQRFNNIVVEGGKSIVDLIVDREISGADIGNITAKMALLIQKKIKDGIYPVSIAGDLINRVFRQRLGGVRLFEEINQYISQNQLYAENQAIVISAESLKDVSLSEDDITLIRGMKNIFFIGNISCPALQSKIYPSIEALNNCLGKDTRFEKTVFLLTPAAIKNIGMSYSKVAEYGHFGQSVFLPLNIYNSNGFISHRLYLALQILSITGFDLGMLGNDARAILAMEIEDIQENELRDVLKQLGEQGKDSFIGRTKERLEGAFEEWHNIAVAA